MDLTVVLILIVFSAIVALVLFVLLQRKPTTRTEEAANEYAEGLNLLLQGRREEALSKLRDSVSKNSKNIDAYLKIGDLLREMGQPEKAINVHKYLTVRKGLSPGKQLEILQCLAQDYHAAKKFDKALQVVNTILEQKKKDIWAQEMKLQIYEDLEAWNKAFDTYKGLIKLKGLPRNGKLALYKVEEGLTFLKKNQNKEARLRFKEAMKIAPDSAPAYIYLADSYIEEGMKDEALKVLKRFIEKVPSQSFLAFDRLKELLFESGVYGEIENLYLELIGSQPENFAAHLALAEIYEKKGELQKAISTCTEVLEKDPGNEKTKKYLVKLYHNAGNDAEAIKLALDLINQSLENKGLFQCKLCGYESQKPFWRCPACRQWDTFTKN
ncbi:MAG: tetratricopeptide repeat protein [bacterium]